MRLWIAALALAVAACGNGRPATDKGTWQGDGVHMVDGVWIGNEVECGDGNAQADAVCRTVVALASAAYHPPNASTAVNVRLAELPTRFRTDGGETRTARLTAGIQTRKAVIIDLSDGTRRVIGLWCYLPFSGDGTLQVGESGCVISPLDWWLDGHAPPSYPPGTVFG